MKKTAFVITLGAFLTLFRFPQAEASSLLSINVDGVIVTCNNTAALCGAGFTTQVGSNSIAFTGTINGIYFGGTGIAGIQLTGNSPGTPTLAFILDTKTSLQNQSGLLHTIIIDVAMNNFTNPVGPAFLSASQTANWTTSTAGDQQAFTAWERNTNDLVVPGGNITAITPNCVSPGGLTQSCNQITPDISGTSTAPFALTGREVVTMAPGTIASYTGTATLTSFPTTTRVPEPGSVFLLGTGILLLAGKLRKRDYIPVS